MSVEKFGAQPSHIDLISDRGRKSAQTFSFLTKPCLSLHPQKRSSWINSGNSYNLSEVLKL